MIPAALESILDRGLRVFPCAPGKKTPLTQHGVKDATADRAQIDEWLGQHPAANWGAAMDADTFALDIDQKNGVDGNEQLLRWIEQHGNLPPHLVNNTPNRGQHHLFHGTGIRNSASKIAPGFDVRGAGGYIVIPPSRLSTGEYRWLDPTAPIPAAPEWLIENLLAAKSKKPQVAGPVLAGQRNEALYRYACLLRARNLPDADGWAALQARNLDCVPPLDSGELQKIFQNAWAHRPGFALTDLGNAERLIAAHGEDWKYVPEIGWCRFQGGLWVPDRGRAIVQVAGAVARAMLTEAAAIEDDVRRRALAGWSVKSESKKALDAMVGLASTRAEVVDFAENFDTDPMLLACRNGVIDLRTGELRAGQREDRLMKAAAVEFDPAAQCPQWEQFLRDTFGDDEGMLAFMGRAAGYTLTGSIAEQVIFIAQGDGANGKSTFIGVLRRLLGEYAAVCPPEMLTNRRSGSIPNDVAGLLGKRLAVASETEAGSKLAESFIKSMSGGDALAARFLHKEWFTFVPSMKLWLLTNHKPKISGSDFAIWRRIVLIPFEHTVSKDRRDKHLEARLFTEEGAGILNWALGGCREWQRVGLAQAQAVVDATRQYRQDEDSISGFLRDCVKASPKHVVRKGVMYDAYRAWVRQQGEDDEPLARKTFHAKLTEEKGFKVVSRDGCDCYEDVAVEVGL